MARLSSSNLKDNEILKSDDLNNGFNAQIDNIAHALISLLEVKQDFVVGEMNLVKPHSDSTNDWALTISPIMGICAYTNQLILETEENIAACSIPEPSDYDRVDIVEMKGGYVTFNEQQRAFIDFDNESKSVSYVDTRKELRAEFRVRTNVGESASAPNKEKGWVKIAEIFVPHNAVKASDCTIYNISSDIAGVDNEGWTNEKTATYNVQYISDVNKRTRQEHEFSGEHKERVIHIKQLDTGVNSEQVNGDNIPVGGETVVSQETIGASESIYDTIKILAEKITDIYDEYLKDGKYSLNREVIIKGDADNQYEVPFLKIGLNADGSAYFKLGDITLLTIKSDGIIKVNSSYTPIANDDLVNKKITDALSVTIANIDSRLKKVEKGLDQSKYSNEVFSRYKVWTGRAITAATNRNIELVNPQTIDDFSCTVGQIVLVKNQTNSKENGLYYVNVGAWARITELSSPNDLKGKLFLINSGSANKNKLFYCPVENFDDAYTFGTDEIPFVEYNGAIEPIPYSYKEVMRKTNGGISSVASVEANDVVIQSELSSKEGALAKKLIDMFYPVGSLYWSASPKNPKDTFGVGEWNQISDCFVLAAGHIYKLDTTGGSATVTLTENNIPYHSHTITPSGSVTVNNHSHVAGEHSHGFTPQGEIQNLNFIGDAAEITLKGETTSGGIHRHTMSMWNDGWYNFQRSTLGSFAAGLTFGEGSARRLDNVEYTDNKDSESEHYHNVEVTGTIKPTGTIEINGKNQKSFVGTAGETAKGGNVQTSEVSGVALNPKFTGTPTTSSAYGKGQAHNNMPPYVVKYCWQRIS